MGEAMKMVYWTTTALQPPFTSDQMYSAMSGILRANPMFGRMSSVFDEMKKMKGVPARELDGDVDGTLHVENSSEATEVKTGRGSGIDLRYSCGLQEGRLADDADDAEAVRDECLRPAPFSVGVYASLPVAPVLPGRHARLSRALPPAGLR